MEIIRQHPLVGSRRDPSHSRPYPPGIGVCSSNRTRNCADYDRCDEENNRNLLGEIDAIERYGTVSREEAVEAAKLIEQEAFEVAGNAVSADDEWIEILQVYSKEISKRMLDTVKARSGESAVAPEPASATDEPHKAEEEDAGSSTPSQSEKTESVADDE
ncbi:hypothetical protein SASPL_110194 [Salvia splendens]|uniref:WPP domain-containing protein n=1 Tax=Salvia splendens TaxID=180675 RepID=A0A8X9A326_SALSN|nr:hypothetical protein SASPL_110194 [Salvia splendens]